MIETWYNYDKKSKKEISDLLHKSERTIRRKINRGITTNLTSEYIVIYVVKAINSLEKNMVKDFIINLKQYVKYRKEHDYLLICDCSIIQNYELPLETFDLFEELRIEYDINIPLNIKMEREIIEDLNNLNLLSDKPNFNEGFHLNNWNDLGYDESKFF